MIFFPPRLYLLNKKEDHDPFPTREVTDRINLEELEDLRNFRKKSSITAHLVVRRPDYSKVQVPLDRPVTVIGRAVKCDIVIKDAKASREHARVHGNLSRNL